MGSSSLGSIIARLVKVVSDIIATNTVWLMLSGFNSATNGAKIVEILATILQIPNAVATMLTGNIE